MKCDNMQRSGSLLESNVARLFKLSGFKPKLNQKINDYEIDVFVKYKSIKLGIECKQYEKSSIAIRNLIHEWDSKNRELKFDKILLILVGCNVSDKHRDLAKRYGISIWDTTKFNDLFDEVIEKRDKLKNKLLIEAGLRSTDEINEEIRKVKSRYGCPEWIAIKFLTGEISEKMLEKLPTFPKIGLAKADLKKFVNNSMWYGVPFRKIVGVMEKYNLKDKKMARILIVGKGKGYSESRINKIKLLMDKLGFSFLKANRYSKRLSLTTVRDVVEILKINKEISFDQALQMRKKTRKSKRESSLKRKKMERSPKKSFLRKLFG